MGGDLSSIEHETSKNLEKVKEPKISKRLASLKGNEDRNDGEVKAWTDLLNLGGIQVIEIKNWKSNN